MIGQAYVVGLLFTETRQDVLLIEKKTPEWQRGKLNGVGGKVEPGETPIAAMAREFHEEAGVIGIEWSPVAMLHIPYKSNVYFFAGFDTQAFLNAESMTPEMILQMQVKYAIESPNLMPNLRVIIPLALDTSGICKPVLLHERG